MPTNVLVLNKSWVVTGAGEPEGLHPAPVGSIYLREEGEVGSSFYIKESGLGTTGWKAVGAQAPQGDVVGPAVSVDDGIVLFSGTTGKLLKDSMMTTATLCQKTVNNNFTVGQTITGTLQATDLGTTPLNANSLTTGTVADARLSATVALTTVANTFTANQTLVKVDPELRFGNTQSNAGQKNWRFRIVGPLFYLDVLDDAFGTIGYVAFINRSGDLTLGGALQATGLSTTPLNANNLTVGVVPNARLNANLAVTTSLAIGTNPAQSGAQRLANAGAIMARNATNTADVELLKLDGTNTILVGGLPVDKANIVSTNATGTANNLACGAARLVTYITCQNLSALTLTGLSFTTTPRYGDVVVIQAWSTGVVSLPHANANSTYKWWNQATSAPTSLAAYGSATYVYDGGGYWTLQQHEQGGWITPAFNAADYSALSPMTWTVAAGNVTTAAYRLSGKTLHWSLYVQNSVVGGTGAAYVSRPLFGGFTAAINAVNPAQIKPTGTALFGAALHIGSQIQIKISLADTAWTPQTFSGIYATATVEVQ